MKWFTLSEAEEYLNIRISNKLFNYNISNIVQMAFEGKITLSIRLDCINKESIKAKNININMLNNKLVKDNQEVTLDKNFCISVDNGTEIKSTEDKSWIGRGYFDLVRENFIEENEETISVELLLINHINSAICGGFGLISNIKLSERLSIPKSSIIIHQEYLENIAKEYKCRNDEYIKDMELSEKSNNEFIAFKQTDKLIQEVNNGDMSVEAFIKVQESFKELKEIIQEKNQKVLFLEKENKQLIQKNNIDKLNNKTEYSSVNNEQLDGYVEKNQKINNQNKKNRIGKVNKQIFSLLVHYKFPGYPTRNKLLEAIVLDLKSKTGINISVESLRNYVDEEIIIDGKSPFPPKKR